MAKTLPLNAFIELVAEATFHNYLDGGTDRATELHWPAYIYEISEVELERKVRRELERMKAKHYENFNQHS